MAVSPTVASLHNQRAPTTLNGDTRQTVHPRRHKVPSRSPRHVDTTAGNHANAQAEDSWLHTSPSTKSASQSSSPHTLKHQSRRISSQPDMPPTPPHNSQHSSTVRSAIASSPTLPEDGIPQASTASNQRTLVTPPDQRSPPTPDETPPQYNSRPRPVRPSAGDRSNYRSTPSESRSASFTTAREDPASSGGEDGLLTMRNYIPSTSTSQTTVRRGFSGTHSRTLPAEDLDLALQHLDTVAMEHHEHTPRTKTAFNQFDGAWVSSDRIDTSASDTEQHDDQHLQLPRTRAATNKSDRLPKTTAKAKNPQSEPPTAAKITEASRQAQRQPARRATTNSDRDGKPQNPQPSSTSSQTGQRRRSSGNSSQSYSSTVVEAFLLDYRPKRRQTLRHVRKQHSLRQASSPVLRSQRHRETEELGDVPKTRGEQDLDRGSTHQHTVDASNDSKHTFAESAPKSDCAPDTPKFRPDSTLSEASRELSIRSIASRRSGKTVSLRSIPFDDSVFPDDDCDENEEARSDEHRSRRRRLSQCDPSDIRTIDYPPAVPRRTSSLSAPTSRNPSRSGSLTSDGHVTRSSVQPGHKYPPVSLFSLTGRDRVEAKAPVAPSSPVQEMASATLPGTERRPDSPVPSEPVVDPRSQLSSRGEEEYGSERRFSFDHTDEVLSTKKYSSLHTPFSVTSGDTNWTAHEISEAHAIQMFPHQNTSLLMVNHSNKPSETSDPSLRQRPSKPVPEPVATASAPRDTLPVTPPQSHLMEDVDSPLRNPRSPPAPPANPPGLNFIPATPSGVTPVPERNAQVGNYYEMMAKPPARRPSLLRRALSRRRHSVDYPPTSARPAGFLARTFSLSKSRHGQSRTDGGNPDLYATSLYPQEDESPAEGDRLHPFWRPQSSDGERFYEYPPVDNRPKPPRRTLSERMKRTFAVLPTRDYESYDSSSEYGPKRLTVKRTPEGSLRVVRNSMSGQAGEHSGHNGSQYARADDGRPPRSFWRGYSTHEVPVPGRRRRSSIEHAVEGIQSLPRRLSERKRERRTKELRSMISAPRAVRDGVGEVVRPANRQHQHSEVSRV